MDELTLVTVLAFDDCCVSCHFLLKILARVKHKLVLPSQLVVISCQRSNSIIKQARDCKGEQGERARAARKMMPTYPETGLCGVNYWSSSFRIFRLGAGLSQAKVCSL